MVSQNTAVPTPPRNIATTGAVISHPVVGALIPPRWKVSQVKLKNTAHRNTSRASTMLRVARNRKGVMNMNAQHAMISCAAIVKPSR